MHPGACLFPIGMRPRKALDPTELATILAYGDRHGDKEASRKYKVSHRTIQRYRRGMREGKAPELARLVAQQKGAAVERCLDLLTETYEAVLRRLQAVLPGSESLREVADAARIVGELCLTRDALRDGDEQSGRDSASAAAQGASEGTPATH